MGGWHWQRRLRACKLLFIYLSTNNCLRRIVCGILNVSLWGLLYLDSHSESVPSFNNKDYCKPIGGSVGENSEFV